MGALTCTDASLLRSLSFLAVMLIGGEAFAQARGDVSARPKGSAGLEALARRMAESPETRLDLYITPQLTYEKFDDYTVFGKFRGPTLPDAEVISPDFSITTTGTSVGANYLFPNDLLLGGVLSYSYANYDFRHGSVTQFNAAAPAAGALGEPLDRSYDEYGFTLAAGYLKDPWAVLLTGGYARRANIETLRRETETVFPNRFIVEAKGDTHSNVYSAGLGVNYRVGFKNGAAITGLSSISYQLEDIASYTERVQSVFSTSGGQIEQISKSQFLTPRQAGGDGGRNQVREFNSQSIGSLPLEIGALFTYPTGDLLSIGVFSLTNLNLGTTYTHDFDNQRRTVKSEFEANQSLSVEYEEKNRNQDFFSFLGALDFDLLSLAGTLSYQYDVGFDEREYGHIFTLQLRVPLTF
jgi:Autotransporter beta-domain